LVDPGESYYRARYYDPVAGRFESEDSIRFYGGENFYVYAGNSAVNFIDPMGYAPCLNVSKFVDTLIRNALPQSKGECGQFVRGALEEGGLDTQGHPTDPKDYGPWLTQHGFSPVPSDNYNPQPGDVAVFQPYPGQRPGTGHIQGWSGANWVSDFIQPPHGIYPGPPYRKA
jgi:uncharacterized protein RhaS with RHS repeats